MNRNERAALTVAFMLSLAMPQDFKMKIEETEKGLVRYFKGRGMNDEGAMEISKILVALVVIVIGVLILAALLPILSDAIATSNMTGPTLVLLGIIPLVVVAAMILWVLSIFDII